MPIAITKYKIAKDESQSVIDRQCGQKQVASDAMPPFKRSCTQPSVKIVKNVCIMIFSCVPFLHSLLHALSIASFQSAFLASA